MKKLRVGIIGVGNCASSFVQGLSFYRDARSNEPPPGLMNVAIGDYHVSDIEVAAAFDVAPTKVGRDVAEAIFAPPNNTYRFAEVPDRRDRRARRDTGRPRKIPARGNRGVGCTRGRRGRRPGALGDRRRRLLSAGRIAKRATEWYTERALEAGCAFVNCMPVFIASRPEWRKRFEERGLPVIGDDIKSQVGATIVHRVLTNLFRERGRPPRSHVSAEFRRQHRFSKHAGARAARIEENLEDAIRDEPARRAAYGGEHPCRPERPRSLAHGSQMGLYPFGGHHIRRRAAQCGAQARSLGLPELRRHRYRCGALCQAGARPRSRRRAHRAFQLLHEVAARAVHRCGGAGTDAALHRERDCSEERADQ